ncbi:MAG: DEAD/DEAH box helicase family protein [Dehalococcoidia bacterium]
MPRTKKPPSEQASLLEVRTKTAPCVPEVKRAVADWRRGGYKGATATTRLLLNYWFKPEPGDPEGRSGAHRLADGSFFQYHESQREAIETLIYLYEIVSVRRHKDLLEKYAPADVPNIRLLQYDAFARYAIKMATGSGKTKVIALAIAWQYFNAVVEGRDDFARTTLLIAPNVIVFERLRTDFEGGRVFRSDPVIPKELEIHWDYDCYMRGDAERASSQGSLYLTNVQQFYERRARKDDDEPDEMTDVLGPKPPATLSDVTDFDDRIIDRGVPCLVVNDEAHHTHDEDSEWNKCIRKLDERLATGLAAQLDFTATPRYNKGSLFTWVVYDYPLKQAIIDNIVKRPVKGIARDISEAPSDIASERYKAYLTAGVERWREYAEQLAPLGKKPILFVMLNSTVEADDVGDYLRTKYPAEFAGEKLLVIHTDNTGEVSKRDLDKAREVAREVDHEGSPVNAIVSVLMLREGWDVQNVTVIVGLRPYTSKANILPEQTVGRGLRLMFRDRSSSPSYVERVDVIGNKKFIEFVEKLEKDEDLELGTFDIGKDKLVIVSIFPEESKSQHDIAIPTLTPVLARKKTLAEEIAGLDVQAMASPGMFKKRETAEAEKFRYEGIDIITLEQVVAREYTIPEVQTAEEVIGYYARRIANDVKLPSQFAALAPKVREFLETRLFAERVDLSDKEIVRAISSNVAQYVTVKAFVAALRELVVEELEPKLLGAGRHLSETPGFPWSRQTLEAKKTVFNLAACSNEFEKTFAKFLEDAEDVKSFAKLPDPFGFAIEYTDATGNLRYYRPDFVAVLESGDHYIIETKGREDLDVAHKDRAAILWCENATMLTDTEWRYVKVPQKEFEQLRADEFADLAVFAPPPLL